LKRTLTGIAAVTLALGTFAAPMTAAAATKYNSTKVAHEYVTKLQTISVNKTESFTVTIKDSHNKAISNALVYFTSYDKGIATVSSSQVVTNKNGQATVVITGHKAGSTWLKVTVNGLSHWYKVTVAAAPTVDLTGLTEGQEVASASQTVTVKSNYQQSVKLYLNGKLQSGHGPTFNLALVEGKNTITAVATNGVDTVKKSVHVTFDSHLKVSSVSAINAIQIQVKFNKPVNKASAETVANYKINGNPLPAGSTATLQADNQTVEIDLPVGSKLINNTAYLFTVSGVQDTSLNTLASTYSQALTFVDTKAPTLSGVTYTDNNHAKVSFSEPMSAIQASQIHVYDSNGNDVTGTGLDSQGLNAGDTDLTIDLSNATVGKTYTVKVYGAFDLSGNPAGTQTFTVTKTNADTTAPTVSSVQATALDTFKVTFSEPIAQDTTSNNRYGTFAIDGGTASDLVASNPAIKNISLSSDKKTLTVQLTTAVTAGLHTVTINNFMDASGNKQTTAYSRVIDFEADTTPPKVVSTQVVNIAGTDYLLVKTDDSNIKIGTATNAISGGTYVNNYVQYSVAPFGTATLYDPAGTGTTDTIKIPLTGKSAGTYTVNLAANTVQDQAGNGNVVTQITFTYTPTNSSTKPAVVDTDGDPNNGISSLVAQSTSSPNTIELQFNHDVTTTALNVNNYTVDGQTVFQSAVFDGDQHHVLLTLKPGAIQATAAYSFHIANVMDAAGNTMDPVTFIQNFTENVAPTLKSATLTGPDEITIVFSESVTDLPGDKATADNNFTVKSGGTALQLATTALTKVDGKTYKIKLANPLTPAQLAAGLTLTVNSTNTIKDASAIQNPFGSTPVTVTVTQ
jgi:hypothetical protein